jgi:hypothetical protein
VSWRSENNPLFVSRLRSIKESPPAAPASRSCRRLGAAFCQLSRNESLCPTFGPSTRRLRFFSLLSTCHHRRPAGQENQKEDDDDGRKKKRRRTKEDGHKSRILSDRHSSIPTRAPKKQIPSARDPKSQPPAGGTDESGNNMPTHY